LMSRLSLESSRIIPLPESAMVETRTSRRVLESDSTSFMAVPRNWVISRVRLDRWACSLSSSWISSLPERDILSRTSPSVVVERISQDP